MTELDDWLAEDERDDEERLLRIMFIVAGSTMIGIGIALVFTLSGQAGWLIAAGVVWAGLGALRLTR